MKAETWGGTRAAAELGQSCARIETKARHSSTKNGGKLQSPGKRIARKLHWNCAAAVLLAGCSTPAVRDRIVEVDKPVAVQPIAAKDVPALPQPLPPRPSSLSAAADTLLSKVCEWVSYGLRADPLLKVSAGEKQIPAAAYPECEGR